MAARINISIIVIALSLSATFATLTHNEHHIAQYSYDGEIGPSKWGSLDPHFAACLTGKMQSPINIVKQEVVFNPRLEPLTRDYHPANATLINEGSHVGLHFEHDGGVLIIDGKNYTLKKMHWHSPSEHQIDGIQYPIELHLVHIANDGSISVVAILYQYGNSDPLVDQMKDHLDQLAKEVCESDEESLIPVGLMKPKHTKRKSRKYFRYIGSLTTPPCTEKVIWSILGKVRSMSKEQVALLKAPLDWGSKNNSRPEQPLNGRRIELYDELKQQ
ncbi:hypothetical protein HHK36_018022 [Tetracentron sinense]|uniref:Carbonic anhydrase n=1 Tax=Tetracentron sinense TaxID=13715 RepID=A0A835DAG1_TETSI|nr:hypothetical protein HHK36_018022 [Tetracentron sinense]